jgi:dipeptidyl aminopeptidase/acylaminoacyl peptidase
MRRLSFLLLVFLLSIPSFPQSKHPFTFEDMMKLKRVGAPQVSPDGKWVLFSVVEVDLEANTRTPHIWVVPMAGGQEREIIHDQQADSPRWEPDGKRFVFTSTKSGNSQLWIADFDSASGNVTGNPRQLTFIETEASGPIWSPDGKNIAFTSDVYPECDGPPAREQECNAKKVKEAAESKVKALIFDHLLYRHWNAYREGKRAHLFVVSANACVWTGTLPCPGGVARDLTPGDYDSPVFSLGGQDNYAFSPDGQELCYTSNHDKMEAASTNNDLWIVPVNGTTDHVGTAASTVQPKNITADNPASDSTPLYSPDGKYIAYRAQKRPGYESDRFRLMLYDRKTGVKRNLTEKFDRWVGAFTWGPNSKLIYFAAENEGGSSIYVISEDIEIKEYPNGSVSIPIFWPILILDGFSDDPSITKDGQTLLFTRMSIQSPSEIAQVKAGISDSCNLQTMQGKWKPGAYKASCDLSRWQPLTHMNNSVLPRVAMSPLESFWFPGALGDKVQGFIVKPPNFDPSKKYPVKFLIHGGPQGAWGDDWSYRWNAQLFAANGYVVIMINFHGSTGYGQKFIDAINGDWGGAPFEDLMKGLDYAEQHYPFIAKDRECALGASYGGYAINWILGHTNRFKCLVSHDGMFNTESAWGTTEELWFNEWEFKGTPYTNRELYRKWSPHLSATDFKTPTLVVHSQRDYRLDVSEGFQLFTTLQRLGVPSKMLYFPDEGHWVLKPQNSRLWYKTVNDWVDQWIGK